MLVRKAQLVLLVSLLVTFAATACGGESQPPTMDDVFGRGDITADDGSNDGNHQFMYLEQVPFEIGTNAYELPKTLPSGTFLVLDLANAKQHDIPDLSVPLRAA
jgi:hypothetical protein